MKINSTKKLLSVLFGFAAIFLSSCATNINVNDYLDEDATTYDYTSEVLWTKNGSKNIYGVLYTPENAGGKMPVCIMSHGFNGSNKNSRNYREAMAQLGYLTYSFDFCGGGNRSKSDGSTTEMSILTERSDLEAVIDYFKSRDDVDTSRICLMGDSQGGMVTALTAADRPDDIERICLFYPALCIPDDWVKKFGTEDQIPETYNQGGVMLGKVYFQAAFSLYGKLYEELSKYKGKVLLCHGTSDSVVPIKYSETAASSECYGDQCEYHVIDGGTHGFHGKYRKESLNYAINFMIK